MKRGVSIVIKVFYYIDNNSEFKENYQIPTKNPHNSILNFTQTKDNEICYLEEDLHKYIINFYDLNERKIQSSFSISFGSYMLGIFNMVNKDLLIIGDCFRIGVTDVNKYLLLKIIIIPDSNFFFSFCMINEKMFLIGDDQGKIIQWRICGNNINLISEKKNAHTSRINSLALLNFVKIIITIFQYLFKMQKSY